MVAYSCKKRFVPDIEAYIKRQMIRANRKRHARPGERIQIYTGMRTKACRKIIPDPVCESVTNIRLIVPVQGGRMQIQLADEKGRFPSERFPGAGWHSVDDAFARADGFTDAEDMAEFWRKEHADSGADPDRRMFEGVLIKWSAPEHAP